MTKIQIIVVIAISVISVIIMVILPRIRIEMLRSDISVETIYISSINDKSDNFVIKNDGKNVLFLSELGNEGEFQILKYDVNFTEIYKTLPENYKPYVEVTSNKYEGITKVKLYVPENAEIMF
jgi:hypothetical protein